MRDNRLKKRLSAGETAIGHWAGSGSPALVELAGHLPYDWILIDCEHGVGSYETLSDQLRALNGSEATSIVRVPTGQDASIFKRVLDAGVEGVLVPQIKTPDEVKAIVSACRYPPEGERGIAGGRAHKYGLDFADTLKRSNDEILVLVQIETQEALDDLESILAVPGLDGVLIGPADLSAALGVTLDLEADIFCQAVEKVLACAKDAGLPAGFYCSTPADARARLNQGFQFVNISNDMSLIARAMSNAFKEFEETD